MPEITPLKSLDDLSKERIYLVIRPLVSNVPYGKPDWEQVQCALCGRLCWKRPVEPQVLPENCKAACSECSISAHLRYMSNQKNQ